MSNWIHEYNNNLMKYNLFNLVVLYFDSFFLLLYICNNIILYFKLMIANFEKMDFIPCDNIITCYKCNNIPIIGLHYTSYGLFIDYYCKNNHKGKIDIETFLNNFQFTKKENYSLCAIHKIKTTKFCYHCIQNICGECNYDNNNHFLEDILHQKLT